MIRLNLFFFSRFDSLRQFDKWKNALAAFSIFEVLNKFLSKFLVL